jgi:hypothetical protein
MTLTLTPKFVRAHAVNTPISGSKALPSFLKVFYEFWGFCMHGTSNLNTPGGFANVNMPAGFVSGTMMTGTNGFTFVGEQFFHCPTIDFTSGNNAVVNHKLVTWIEGSTSTDDSIYQITQVINSSTIRVNTFTGATPYSASLVPYFSTRSGINFRIIDFPTLLNATTFASGNSMTINLSGAVLVNSGQVTPQVKMALTTTTLTGDTMAISWSPSGSWNGSSFTDEVPVTARQWTNAATLGIGNYSIIAADDFVLAHFVPRGTTGWDTVGNGSGFHVEVPQRLYPQNNDPNPVAGMIWGRTAINTTQTTENYGGGWWMHLPILPQGQFNLWTTLVRSPVSDYFPGASNRQFGTAGNFGSFGTGRHNMIFFNPFQSKFFVSDVLLANLGTFNQFSLGRVRLRRFKATSLIPPSYQRLGASGEWIHVSNGVIWPWDNAVIPSFNPSGL